MDMSLEFVESYVTDLMDEYGLIDKGWTFIWSNGARIAGHCSHSKKQIAFSRKLVKAMTRSDMRDIAIHEVAHAIVGPNVKDHGYEWRMQDYRMGGNGERCHNLDPDKTIVRHKYIGTCENGHAHHKDRMGKHMAKGNLVCVKDGCRKSRITWKSNVPVITNPIVLDGGFVMAG